MSEVQKLTIGNLDNGRAASKVNELLNKLAEDISERPNIKKPRKVTLEIEIMTDPDEDTGFNVPKIGWKATHSVPGSKGTVTSAFYDKDGNLSVNINDPIGDDPSQPTLFSSQVIGME